MRFFGFLFLFIFKDHLEVRKHIKFCYPERRQHPNKVPNLVRVSPFSICSFAPFVPSQSISSIYIV
jgi:hypothetical protein